MPSPNEIRVLLSNVLTKLEELRGHDSIVSRIEDVELTIRQLKKVLPVDVLGNKAGKWTGLAEDDQNELLARLKDVQSRLRTIDARVRCPTPDEVKALKQYAVVMFSVFLCVIFYCVCKGAIPGLSGEGSAAKTTAHPAFGYLMLLGLGGFGACVRLFASLAKYLGKGQFFRSWLSYYYFMPLEGAGMALIVCLLFGAGIISTNGATGPTGVTDGDHPTRLLFVYGMAGIAGMFSQNVSAKLRELSIALFGKPSTEGSA